MKHTITIFAAMLVLGTGPAFSQDVLPFPEPGSASAAGKTLKDSKHQWRKAEYNAMTLNRYKVASKPAIPTGKVKIEVENKYDSIERMAPATLTLSVNGKEVGDVRIERSVPAVHTASGTYDVGSDLGSPVALDHYDRAPFKFNGKIERIHIC